MSCEACELAQDRVFAGIGGVAFYRWRNANVAIVGCDVHVREIMDCLNARGGE